MKKIICTLLVCCVLLFCVACGTSSAPKDNAEAPVKIAAMVAQEDQFMQLVLKGYKQAAEDLGVELMTASIGFDQAKEVELIDTYVQQGVQGIAIVPLSSDVSAEALRKASDAGVKVGISNMAIQNQEFIVGGYVSDNYELGQGSGIKAREFIEKELGGVAKIAVLQFMSLVPEVSDARYRGFVDEVSKLPGVEIVADQDAWVQDKAVQVAGDIITANPDVDIIWGANEGGTIGAVMAVKNANKQGEVFVFGTDATEQILQLLQEEDNILQTTTGQDPYTMGYRTVETVYKAIKGEDVSATAGKTVNIPTVVLSRTDMDGVKAFEADFLAKVGG